MSGVKKRGKKKEKEKKGTAICYSKYDFPASCMQGF